MTSAITLHPTCANLSVIQQVDIIIADGVSVGLQGLALSAIAEYLFMPVLSAMVRALPATTHLIILIILLLLSKHGLLNDLLPQLSGALIISLIDTVVGQVKICVAREAYSI